MKTPVCIATRHVSRHVNSREPAQNSTSDACDSACMRSKLLQFHYEQLVSLFINALGPPNCRQRSFGQAHTGGLHSAKMLCIAPLAAIVKQFLYCINFVAAVASVVLSRGYTSVGRPSIGWHLSQHYTVASGTLTRPPIPPISMFHRDVVVPMPWHRRSGSTNASSP